jgi:hypothetical protein
VYALKNNYRKKGQFSREEPLPVYAAIWKSRCNNNLEDVNLEDVFKMLLWI